MSFSAAAIAMKAPMMTTTPVPWIHSARYSVASRRAATASRSILRASTSALVASCSPALRLDADDGAGLLLVEAGVAQLVGGGERVEGGSGHVEPPVPGPILSALPAHGDVGPGQTQHHGLWGFRLPAAHAVWRSCDADRVRADPRDTVGIRAGSSHGLRRKSLLLRAGPDRIGAEPWADFGLCHTRAHKRVRPCAHVPKNPNAHTPVSS